MKIVRKSSTKVSDNMKNKILRVSDNTINYTHENNFVI